MVTDIKDIIKTSTKGIHASSFSSELFEHSHEYNRYYTFYNKKLYFGGLCLNTRNFTELSNISYFNTSLTYALYELAAYDIDLVSWRIAQYTDCETIHDMVDNNLYTPEVVEDCLYSDFLGIDKFVAFGITPDKIDQFMDHAN